MWLLEGDDTGVWSIVRATLPALKATAYRDFVEILESLNVLGTRVHWSRTEFTFTFGPRIVEFFALDDPQKIWSRKRAYLHLVEANEIEYDSFIQLLIRTSVRVYIDFNPDVPDIWIRTELEDKRADEMRDVETIVSTYKDNPFLHPGERAEIEYLQRVDPELWQVFGTGEYGRLTGTIFQQPILIDTFPNDIEIIYGAIDWGFSHDPTAVLKVGRNGEDLFIDELLFERGLVNSQIIERIPKNILYVADSAEPKSIEDFRRAQMRIIPSVKGADSIRSGINRMNEFRIHVTKRSVNTLKEFRSYKWDKDGDPIDAFNHAIDAVRYVVQTKMKRANATGGAFIVNSYGRAV